MNIVLVHGSYAGAWIWDLVTPELERRGHRVTAVDLPISDPAAGGAAYAQAIIDAVDWSEPPVIVAHSSSGLVAPLVAAEREVRSLIFLAAMLAKPGTSANDQRGSEPIDAPTAPTTAQWTDLGDGVWAVGPDTATELFWHDAPPDIAAWAGERGRSLRPQSYLAMNETTPARLVACRRQRVHRVPRRSRDQPGLAAGGRRRATRGRTRRPRWRPLADAVAPRGARRGPGPARRTGGRRFRAHRTS